MKDLAVILAAAGSGTRMGRDKLMLRLGDYTVLQRSALAFASCAEARLLVAITRPDLLETVRIQLEALHLPFEVRVMKGGATRQQSVAAGVAACPENVGYYAIHDAARPLVTPQEISCTLADARTYGGACLAAPVKDTIQQSDKDGFLVSTPPRDRLWAAQTPQIFEAKLYRLGLELARQRGLDLTDDCQIARLAGGRVYLTRGGYRNLKITTPEDLTAAEQLLRESAFEEA